MKLLRLCILTRLFSNATPLSIPTKKICRDCRHFIGNDFDCRKFGDTDLITGKVTYRSARSIREDKKKCGEDAIHFEENHYKIVTVPYYFAKNYSFILLPFSVPILYSFIITWFKSM